MECPCNVQEPHLVLFSNRQEQRLCSQLLANKVLLHSTVTTLEQFARNKTRMHLAIKINIHINQEITFIKSQLYEFKYFYPVKSILKINCWQNSACFEEGNRPKLLTGHFPPDICLTYRVCPTVVFSSRFQHLQALVSPRPYYNLIYLL